MPLIQRQLNGPVDLLRLQRHRQSRYPLLLQSVAGGNAQSRWDMLLIANGEGIALANGETRDLNGQAIDLPFLDVLDARFASCRSEHRHDVPFSGGWAVYLGYELAGQVEPTLRLPAFDGPLPDALALRCPAALLHDRQSNAFIAVAEHGYEYLLDDMLHDIPSAAAADGFPVWRGDVQVAEEAPGRFTRSVVRILDYLNAGDVFQVNISRAWRGNSGHADAHALYHRLCELNPSPFAGLMQFADWSLISSSPERLVSVRDDVVQTRPIAGTRPRLPDDDELDKIKELIGHPKERAEHVMLIDLERNDLGRVCVPGSVHVDELMSIESYRHVHHIVSNVSGRLAPDRTPGQVIAAVFPGGTITGCPKVRCMQIIAELEQTGRGPYTGALGYLNRNGSMDLNILIRSLWLSEGRLELRAGAGIVVDSDPEHELQETRAKAKGLLRALGAAE
ncbi:MAG TPA: aminodeoxychorismate synthase component I [Arenimonas sp.]|nr:aminodeoxychorismate synthase component I [Arenimonas sp.]